MGMRILTRFRRCGAKVVALTLALFFVEIIIFRLIEPNFHSHYVFSGNMPQPGEGSGRLCRTIR